MLHWLIRRSARDAHLGNGLDGFGRFDRSNIGFRFSDQLVTASSGCQANDRAAAATLGPERKADAFIRPETREFCAVWRTRPSNIFLAVRPASPAHDAPLRMLRGPSGELDLCGHHALKCRDICRERNAVFAADA